MKGIKPQKQWQIPHWESVQIKWRTRRALHLQQSPNLLELDQSNRRPSKLKKQSPKCCVASVSMWGVKWQQQQQQQPGAQRAKSSPFVALWCYGTQMQINLGECEWLQTLEKVSGPWGLNLPCHPMNMTGLNKGTCVSLQGCRTRK